MNFRIQHHPYVLPLTSAWPGMRNGRLKERRGWIVTLEGEDSHGLGDCAPFSSAGTESLLQAQSFLQQLCSRSWSKEALLAELARQRCNYPAGCCAVETALLDIHGRNKGVPLRILLNSAARSRIQVNAMAGSICQQDIRTAQTQGFSVIKLKAGLQEPQQEISCLLQLSSTLAENTRLRLDANGSWNLDQARYFLDAVAELPIESIEEPLREPSLEAFARLQSHTPITLALDESLAKMSIKKVLGTACIRRLILKPGVHGGLQYSYALAEQATAAGMEVVITSLVDSAVGIQVSSQLAAAVDVLAPGLAHGLATSSWLGKDVAKPPAIKAGCITLNNSPGLGIDEIFPAPFSSSLP